MTASAHQYAADEVIRLVNKLRARERLTDEECGCAAELIETWSYVIKRLQAYDLSIGQLQHLVGIPSQRWRRPDVTGTKTDAPGADSARGATDDPAVATGGSRERDSTDGPSASACSADTEPSSPPSASSENTEPPTSPDPMSQGAQTNRHDHGRRGWDDFGDVPVCHHAHTELVPGCPCPRCQRGRLYPYEPARFASISGQPPLVAARHEVDRLQCNVCKAVFTAPLSEELVKDGVNGRRLYSFSAGSGVCIHKYFGGTPWFRQQMLQTVLGVKVPDASMSDLCERVANAAAPVARYLRRRGRDARIFLGDDTGALILEVRSTTRAERKSGKLTERTGCHVSCIIAVTREGHRIVIFRVGIQHTGELLDEILAGRDPKLPAPLFMGDCHVCNAATVCRVIYGACNAHAVCKFKKLKDRFPQQAGYALERYKKIFDHEAHCKSARLDDDQRLAYHREHSKPLFDEIAEHGEALFAGKLIEPNSDIGEAYQYVLNNRVRLSAFLRHPGMPLDNNETERRLRGPVRLRDNAPFFKNSVGAAWAETLWTVGYTAMDCGTNLLHYFDAMQRHAEDVRCNPHLWVPWAYQQRLQALENSEIPQHSVTPPQHHCPNQRAVLDAAAALSAPHAPDTRQVPLNRPGASSQPAACGSNPPQPTGHGAGVDLLRPLRRLLRPARTQSAQPTSASS